MPRENLTDFFVKNVEPPATGRIEYFDKLKTGLVLRITHRGAKSWSVYDRLQRTIETKTGKKTTKTGKKFRHTLGSYPTVSLKEARALATEALALAGSGEDPRELRARERAEQAKQEADTVAVTAEAFIAKHLSKLRSGERERILRREIIPVWGPRPMKTITRRDVRELVEEIAERAPVLGNRVLSCLKKFFAWALQRDIVDADPTARIDKPTLEASRDRVLSDVELAAFWRGCDAIGEPFGPLFKILAITARRKAEIARLPWSRLNAEERVIEIPGAIDKDKKPRIMPIPDDALQILGRTPVIGDMPTYVFTTTGKTPVSGFTRAKRRLDRAMEIVLREALSDEASRQLSEPLLEPWHTHDLRATARTNLSKLGVAEDIGERVLGHAKGGVRAIYDRWTYVPEMRDALNRWAAHLAGIVNPPVPGKVVTLTSGARR